MNSTVIDNICLYYLITVGSHYISQRISQKIIAYMSQMKRFVGVGRRILNHHQWRVVSSSHDTVLLVRMNAIQQFYPRRGGNGQVQEALNDIKCCNRRLVCLQVFTDFLGRLLRSFLGHTEEREYNQREMSLKFFLGFLQLHLCGRNILSVKRFQSADDGRYQFLFYIHDSNVFSCVQR